MPRQQSLEFVITNRLRSLIFVLLFAELFLLAVWLIPAPWNAIVIAAVVVTTFLATLVSRAKNELEKQINDRIQLKRDGVEYSSGVFGDSWLRPYNEFRVECTPRTLLCPRYRVRLKHRVLPNVIVQSTFDPQKAQSTADRMVENSRLRMLRQQVE